MGEGRRWTAEAEARCKAAGAQRRAEEKAEHEAWVAAGCPQVDLAAAVRWVLASLNVSDPGGCPGPEARTLLKWARKNREKFYQIFVTRLGQGGKGKPGEAPDADHAADEAILKRLRGEG